MGWLFAFCLHWVPELLAIIPLSGTNLKQEKKQLYLSQGLDWGEDMVMIRKKGILIIGSIWRLSEYKTFKWKT